MGSKKRAILVALVGLAVLALVAVLAAVVVAPRAARTMVEERLVKIESRTGLKPTFEELEIAGLGEVYLKGFSIADADKNIVRVETIRAEIDPIAVLYGERRIQTLEVSGVRIDVRITADGEIELLEILKRRPASQDEGAAGSGGGLASRLDSVPEATFRDVVVAFTVAQGGPLPPLSQVKFPQAAWSWDGSVLQTSAQIEPSAADPRIQLPPTMSVEMTFDETLKPTAGNLKFDGVMSVSGLEPVPFVKVDVGGLAIDADGGAVVSDVAVWSAAHKVASLEHLRFALGPLPELKNLKFSSVALSKPTLYVDYSATGASALGDIVAAVRPEAPLLIQSTASRVAQAFAAARKAPSDEEESPREEVDTAPVEATGDVLKRWLERLPSTVDISAAGVVVSDPRKHPVLRPAKNLELRDGTFKIDISPESGEVVVQGGFEATAEKAERGSVSVDLTLFPVKRSISGHLDIDGLDLSWASQMAGARATAFLHGGTLRSKIEFADKGANSFDIRGTVSVTDAVVFDARIAEEAVADINASYTFDASFDGAMAAPPATYLKTGVYPDPAEGQTLPPEPKGALVFHKGAVEVGKVKMTLRPSFYGFNAPRRLPARLDVHVDLPRTSVMDLLGAVPASLLGAASETQMSGYFEWKFNAEIPLYRAGDMEWKAQPRLSEFALISMPHEVDVRRLMNEFDLTIVDSIEEEDDFTRTIRVGAARPYPIEWMLENTGLTVEQIDERRRERGWPELPTREDGVRDDIIGSSDVWQTNWMKRQEAARPWNDGDPVEPTKDWPYGPYVYVPIQYISPYLVRAVITTEDNSFFTHDGFNTLALKESIERNMSAGEFKRGASTIAMQMVKNVFLNRKKVLSRKLQEAFLVFLMESAIDLPKARIMEIYLNVIEFGPGIFGIHEGSVHYFGKRPDELTLSEVAWLVSIIPGPKKFHSHYERGEISASYFSRMKRYISAMLSRGRITQEEFDAAVAEVPTFYKPAEGEPLLKPKAEAVVPLFEENTPPPMLLAPPADPE